MKKLTSLIALTVASFASLTLSACGMREVDLQKLQYASPVCVPEPPKNAKAVFQNASTAIVTFDKNADAVCYQVTTGSREPIDAMGSPVTLQHVSGETNFAVTAVNFVGSSLPAQCKTCITTGD